MTDIESVIKIPKEVYAQIIDENGIDSMLIPYRDIIKNGTPLPKGHGRLIDADEIQFENNEFDTYGDYSKAFDAIDYAPTIIEADKAEGEVSE